MSIYDKKFNDIMDKIEGLETIMDKLAGDISNLKNKIVPVWLSFLITLSATFLGVIIVAILFRNSVVWR